jgi:TPR repeat protein
VRVLLAGVVVMVGLGAGRVGDADVRPAELAGAEQRLAARFASRRLAYPPLGVALVALKSEARLELWAEAGDGWNFVRSYLIRASSGRLGPKLREGDHQVPEGVYRVVALNPNSSYHLSLRLDYPNAFDRARAADDGRARLGGDIMIHGGAVSDGCLPIGDAAIEEIFALVERVGTENVPVIVSPVDLRRADPRRAQARAVERPAWLPELYASIARALEPFALPAEDPPALGQRTREARAGCKPYDEVDCVRRCGARDVASCARAGLLYEGEFGVAPDPIRAWSFLRRACDGGDAFGCAELARLYLADDGPRRDAARAAGLAETACAGGDGHGCSYLARLCVDRTIYAATPDGCGSERVRRLEEAAVAHLRAGCRGWDAYDCTTLADIYYPQNPGAALRFAAGACDGGDPGGCFTLARLTEDGGDAAGAATLYARACRHGYPPACEREGSAAPRTIAAARALPPPPRATQW